MAINAKMCIQGSRASKEPIFIDIDHPKPSAELDSTSTAIPQTPNPSHFTPISRLQPRTEPQKWSSPAFLKRSQLPYATYFRTQYDAAQDEGIFEDSRRTKKLRFGRNSDQWVFTDILPSPGPLDTQSREESKSISPVPQGAEKDRSSLLENNSHHDDINDHTLPNTNDQPRLSPVDINRSGNRSSPSQLEHTSFGSNDQHGVSHVETEVNPANIEPPTPNANDGDERTTSPPVNPVADQPSTSENTPDSTEVQFSAYEKPSFQADSPQQVSLEYGNHHIPNDQPTVQQKQVQNPSLDIQGDKKLDEQKIQTLPRQSESLSGKVEHKLSGATEADTNMFSEQTDTPQPRSYQPSPSPNPMDSDQSISQFIPQQSIQEGPISSTGQNKNEQVYDVIELSSGESEEDEDIEESEFGAIDDDQAIEEDDEDEDEEDEDEEDDDEEEDEEINDYVDEDEDDEGEENSDEEDIGYYNPLIFPPSLSVERADSDYEFEMHDSDLDTGPLGEEYTNSSQVLSIVDDSDGDSSYHLAKVYPLDELSNSDRDGNTPRHGPSTEENHAPESPEDGPHLPEERYNLDSESVPFSGDARDRRLSTSSERPGVNALSAMSHTPPYQSRRIISSLPSNNQPSEDAGKEGAEVDSISVASSRLSDESTSKVFSSGEVMMSGAPETMGLPLPQDQAVDVVDEVNRLSDERETSVMDSREFEVVDQELLVGSPHENASEIDLSSAADLRNEEEISDNQANRPRRRSSEFHELEVSPEYEQPTNERYSHDVERGNHPELQIRTLNEDNISGQPEAVLREDGVDLRYGESLSGESEDVPENNTTATKIKDSESLDEHLSPEQLDSPGDHPEESISERQDSDKEDASKEADSVVSSGDMSSVIRDEADDRDGNPSPKKRTVEIIDLEGEDGDYGADEAWVGEEGSSGPTDTNPQPEKGPEAEKAGDAPDLQSSSLHFVNQEGRRETSFREVSISLDNDQEIKPDTLLTLPQTLIPNSDAPILEDVVEELPTAQMPSRQLPNANFLSEPSTLTMKYEGPGESEYQPFSSEQLATPRNTQQRDMDVEISPIPSQPIDGQQSLLTPHLTQNTSAPPLPPASPELPPKQTVREKLRAMKSLSAEMARARTDNMSNSVGPWFVRKKESQVTHVSDSENEAASVVDVEAITGQHEIFVEDEEEDMEEEVAEKEEVEDDPAYDDPAQDDLIQDDLVQDDPAQDDIAQDDPVQDDPVQDDPAQDDPAQDDPAQDDPAQDDPTQDDPIQNDMAQDDSVQGDPAEEADAGEENAEDHYLIEASHDDSPARLPMPEHVLPTTPTTNPILSTQHPGFRTSFSYFAPLATICNHFNELVDTLVIVLSSTDITLAQGGPRHWNQAISIIDPSSSSSSTYEATIAQIFRRYKQAFPSIRQGDAILLRDFKVQSFQNRLGLLSTDRSAWAVFRKGVDVQIHGPPVEFGAEERGFARGLWDWWGSVGEEVRRGIEESAAVAGEMTGGEKGREGSAQAEDNDDDGDDAAVEEIVTPTKRGRPKGRRRGQSVVRHELRDGTTYMNSPRRNKANVHELRDGTTYSDSIEP